MNDRYVRFYSLKHGDYVPDENCPVACIAGALMVDKQQERIVGQLKFRNISENNVISISVSIRAFDEAGNELQGINEFVYQNICVSPNIEFGGNRAIVFNNVSTRSIKVKITKVLFENATEWTKVENEIIPVNKISNSEEKTKKRTKTIKKIVCEVCGGSDFIKKEGCFICNSCSTKYSLGEVKNLIVESEVEDDSPTPNVAGSSEYITCKNCGTKLTIDTQYCGKCGKAVHHDGKENVQRVEVASVNLNIKKRTKKIITVSVIIVLILAIAGIIGMYVYNNYQEQKALEEATLIAEEYYSNLQIVSFSMLSGAVYAEETGNLIKSVWSNSIYEKNDSATDKYTRKNNGYGSFYDDFNDALANLFADKSFKNTISKIEENQQSVSRLMKELKNPPEEFEDAYDALKEYYEAYLKLTNLATSPTGSLQTYSTNFSQADTDLLNCYNAMKLYIEE